MVNIFISYAREDDEHAKELANRLRIDHQVFLDTQSTPGGSEWQKVLIKEIASCDVLILLITKDSNQSKYVYQEFSEAKSRGKKVIPVQVDGTHIPQHLRELHALPLNSKNYDPLILDLTRAFRPNKYDGPRVKVNRLVLVLLFIIIAIAVIALAFNTLSTKYDKTITVDASKPVETGIFVAEGDTLSITYISGEWALSPNEFLEPGGDGPGPDNPCTHLDESEFGPNALIGRIDGESENLDWFPILTYRSRPRGYSEIITVSGQLILQPNECEGSFSGNQGSIEVRVVVR